MGARYTISDLPSTNVVQGYLPARWGTALRCSALIPISNLRSFPRCEWRRKRVISRGSRAKPADLPHGVLAGALPKMWEMSLSALMNASIACEGSEAMESGNVDSSSFG